MIRGLVRLGASPAVTLAPFVAQAVHYGILIVAVITALTSSGPLGFVLTVVGTTSLAIALALQSALSNVAAGIMLAWIRPVAVGDYTAGDGVEDGSPTLT